MPFNYFLVWLLWLGIPILCWFEVVKLDTLVLFLILRGKVLVLAFEYDAGCKFLLYGIYYVEECSVNSHFADCFYHKWMLYLIKCSFSMFWYNHWFSSFAYVMYYIYWLANIVPFLNPWNESYLIIVDDLFNELLDALCQYFLEDFSNYVHQQQWLLLSFFCCVFNWF